MEITILAKTVEKCFRFFLRGTWCHAIIRFTFIRRNTQEAEGVGLENREAANNRAGVQIPLSPPKQKHRPQGWCFLF